MRHQLVAEHVEESGFSSKLKYIIIFGVPVVSAVALYYYLRRNKEVPKTNGVKKTNLLKEAEIQKRAQARKLIEESLNAADPFERSKGYKNKGNEHFKSAEFAKAIDCYSEAINLCPREKAEALSVYYQNRAAAYLNMKKTDEAIVDCDKAIELNKTYVKALFRRAKAYEMKGDLKKCLEDITCVTILEQFQNETSLMLADRVLKTIGKEEAKQLMQVRIPVLPSRSFLKNYFVSFCEDPILPDLKRLTEEGPNIENPQKTLTPYDYAVYLLSNKRYDEVIAACTKEIERDGPNLYKALLLRAALCLLMGEMGKANEDVQRVINSDHADVKSKVNAYIKSATCHVHEERFEQALEDFKKAIDLDPNNADTYLHRSQVYLIMNDIEESYKCLEKSAKLNENFASAQAQKCYTKYRCGLKYQDESICEAAMQDFEKVHTKFPQCSEGFFLYAQLLMERQEFDQALRYLKKAADIDPEDANIYVHMAMLELQWHQDIEKALENLHKAINVDDKCQFAYETLGSLHIQQGQTREGLASFDKAIEIAQTETELAHLLALKASAEAQFVISERLGIHVPGNAQAA